MSIARTGRQRRRVSATLMDIMICVLMTGNLDLAPAALTSRYRRLRILRVPPLSQRHAPDGHGSVRRLRLLNVNLTMIDHLIVLVHARSSIRRLLQFSAQPFLRFGHRGDRRELLQQRVSPESALNGQRGVPRLHTAVLSLQHLDLLV